MTYSDQVVQAESGGNPNSADPNSSASGPAGFINSTWVDMLRRHRPDIANGKSDDELISLKTDPDLSKSMADAYASDNAAILSKNGLPVTSGTQYLAHFAGPGGAVSVLKADPTASAAEILGARAAKANPFLANMTAGDLIAWANRKMGSGAAPVAPQAVVPAQTPQPQTAPTQGLLAQQTDAQPATGILNSGGNDDALASFRNTLASLAAQQQAEAQNVPPMQQIAFAVPRGVSRSRLIAALSKPIGG